MENKKLNSAYTSIDPCLIPDNLIRLVASDWMLITAGDITSFNTMTASWGAFGELWNRKICICFVRPTRHTYQFMERAEVFTLTFFEDSFREILRYCGSVSGRDKNKMHIAGLTPVASSQGAVYFSEARLVLECRKIYCDDLDPGKFLDSAIELNYPQKDYHRFYIGEILSCLKRDSDEKLPERT